MFTTITDNNEWIRIGKTIEWYLTATHSYKIAEMQANHSYPTGTIINLQDGVIARIIAHYMPFISYFASSHERYRYKIIIKERIK